MDWRTFITLGHIIGTVLGVGGATFAEIFYIKASRDGIIDPVEKEFLKTTYRFLRIGLIVLIISGFGYLILARLTGQTANLYNPRLWAKMLITVVLLLNAIALQARIMPLWLGSGVSLASWYAALILGAWRTEISFFKIIFIYVLAVIIITAILYLIKKSLIKKSAQ